VEKVDRRSFSRILNGLHYRTFGFPEATSTYIQSVYICVHVHVHMYMYNLCACWVLAMLTMKEAGTGGVVGTRRVLASVCRHKVPQECQNTLKVLTQ
jgi:hypothetical protein